jgi:hypothetical protein
MKTYSEFAPTSFDPKGLVLSDKQDWLVAPVTHNRDSDHMTESNFDTALSEIGGEGDDVEVHRFGHWGPGWFEIILVRPGSEAAEKAEKIEKRLENYSILDEDDMCRRENDAYNEQWTSWGAQEFVREVSKKFGFDDNTQEKLEEVDKETLRELFEEAIPAGDYYDEQASPVIRRAMHSIKRDDVEALLTKQTPTP